MQSKITSIGLALLSALLLSFAGMVIGFVFESSLTMKISFVAEVIMVILFACFVIGQYSIDEWFRSKNQL